MAREIVTEQNLIDIATGYNHSTVRPIATGIDTSLPGEEYKDDWMKLLVSKAKQVYPGIGPESLKVTVRSVIAQAAELEAQKIK